MNMQSVISKLHTDEKKMQNAIVFELTDRERSVTPAWTWSYNRKLLKVNDFQTIALEKGACKNICWKRITT